MSTLPSIDQMRHYIVNDLLKTPDVELEDSQDLLMSGILDSLNVVRLVSFVEETGGITVPPEDLLPENFGSLSCIHQYLQLQQGLS